MEFYLQANKEAKAKIQKYWDVPRFLVAAILIVLLSVAISLLLSGISRAQAVSPPTHEVKIAGNMLSEWRRDWSDLQTDGQEIIRSTVCYMSMGQCLSGYETDDSARIVFMGEQYLIKKGPFRGYRLHHYNFGQAIPWEIYSSEIAIRPIGSYSVYLIDISEADGRRIYEVQLNVRGKTSLSILVVSRDGKLLEQYGTHVGREFEINQTSPR